MSSIELPDWFVKKDYSWFKSLNSKEISLELEIRRLQLFFLEKSFDKNEIHPFFWGNPLLNANEVEEHLNNVYKELYEVTRKNIQILTIEYNNSLNSNENMILKGAFLLYSKIVLHLYDLKAARKTTVKEIVQNYSIMNSELRLLAYYREIGDSKDDNVTNVKLLKKIENALDELEFLESIKRKDGKNFTDDDGLFKAKNGLTLDLNLDHLNSELFIGDWYMSFNLDGSLDSEMDKLRSLFSGSGLNKSLPPEPQSKIIITVDVNSTDEQITRDVLKLTNEKRSQQNIKPPESYQLKQDDKKSGGKRVMSSIIDQRIFQYIDLMIWAKQNKLKLTSDWYIQNIFKDLIEKNITVAHSKMNDTIKPLAKKCLNPKWLEMFFKLSIESYNQIHKSD